MSPPVPFHANLPARPACGAPQREWRSCGGRRLIPALPPSHLEGRQPEPASLRVCARLVGFSRSCPLPQSLQPQPGDCGCRHRRLGRPHSNRSALVTVHSLLRPRVGGGAERGACPPGLRADWAPLSPPSHLKVPGTYRKRGKRAALLLPLAHHRRRRRWPAPLAHCLPPRRLLCRCSSSSSGGGQPWT